MSSQQLLCAISYSMKRLGAAIYDEDEKEVKIILDMAEDDDFIVLGQLLRELKPTHILANRSQDPEFQAFLRKECNNLMTDLMDMDCSGNGGIGVVDSATVGNQSCLIVPETPINNRPTSLSFGSASAMLLNNASMIRTQQQQQTQLINSSSNSRQSGGSSTSSVAFSRFSAGLGVNESIAGQQQKGEELETTFWRPNINFLPDIAFSFGLAKRRLEQMFSDGVHNERLMASFRFDYSSTNMIRALGALFRFMEQQKAGTPMNSSSKKQQKEKEDAALANDFDMRSCIDKFSTYLLSDCIEVDSTTVRALEIFYSEYTPQSIRQKFVWGNNRREGMSIFKLCNLCRSTPGKQMLRMWFERPTKDLRVLTSRHEAIAFLYQDSNLEITASLHNYMKDVSAVKGIYRRMRRGNVPVNGWKSFFTTICTLVNIGQGLDEREVNLAILKDKRSSLLGSKLKEIATLLIQVIDFQETFSENRVAIQKGIDEDLDRRKDLYEKLPDELTTVAKLEAEDILVDGCSVAYVPLIGYLLMVSELAKIPQSTSQLVELIFTSDCMSYYKTKRMRLLDENVGDIKMQIVDIETNIVLNLQKRLLDNRQAVLQAVELAATLDCLIALSAVARRYNWVRPKFVDQPVLAIEQARHPISEHLCQAGHKYVPNPIISSTEVGKVKVLFGPNASGKSVYLKMVGIVVYMAHVGCFVPAQRATIGPINRIMSRLYTVDSVLDGMSSFANDLKQMSRAISRSDQHSLLIIDEFGKGTMTEVGLSLLASSLNFWLEGTLQRCPHVLVASHFHALPELLRDPQRLVRFQTMGVLRLDDDTLDFHFNLMDGCTDLSYANYTALKMGIPREVVDRAEEVYINLRAGGALSELEPIYHPHKRSN